MLDNADRITLLTLARITLESYLSTNDIPEYHTSRGALLERKGVFVSLHRGEELRGCIGQTCPDRELYKMVQHCALSAALEDSRFIPVKIEEMAGLTIEISVLTPFGLIRDPREIEVGKHGLYVIQGRFRGLLLPQVASHYKWDVETFLAQACQKAGLPESAWHDSRTIIRTFEAQVFSESEVQLLTTDR